MTSAVEITLVVKAKQGGQESVTLTLEAVPDGDDPSGFATAIRQHGSVLVEKAAIKLDRLYGTRSDQRS